MKQHPAALIPFRVVAAELRKVARSLRLVPMSPRDAQAKPQHDGKHAATVQDSNSATSAPAITNRVIAMPPVFIDFFDWMYVPPQNVGNVPATGTHWLRIKVAVAVDYTEAINGLEPVNVTSFINPQYEWYEDEFAGPSEQSGVAYGDLREYYWYLLRVTNGVVEPIYSQPTLLLNSNPNLHA